MLDRDQTTLSRSYALNLSGSRYFSEQPPLTSYADLDRAHAQRRDCRWPSRSRPVSGATCWRGQPARHRRLVRRRHAQRAETVEGYVQGMHQHWLAEQVRERTGRGCAGRGQVETRFRYNPGRQEPAGHGAGGDAACCCSMLPAMLTALAVVREKELGSIINLYVTPVTRIEFLLGKQLPYVALAMLNFLLMCAAGGARSSACRSPAASLTLSAGGAASSASSPPAWACWRRPSRAARLRPCSSPCWAP